MPEFLISGIHIKKEASDRNRRHVLTSETTKRKISCYHIDSATILFW